MIDHTLKLPYELLIIILDLCRPDAFESAVLACKRWHATAQQLIINHNFCRQRVSAGYADESVPGFGIVEGVRDLSKWLVDVPPEVHLDVFRYFKHVADRYASNQIDDKESDRDRLLTKFGAWKEIVKELLRIEEAASACTKYNAIEHVSYRDYGNEDWENYLMEPSLYLLPLMINVESLVIARPDWSPNNILLLSRLITSSGACQRLKHLWIPQARELSPEVIAPIIALPQIKILVLEFLAYGCRPYHRQPIPRGVFTSSSSLEYLCVIRSTWEVQIGPLLKCLPSLRSFVWIDEIEFHGPANASCIALPVARDSFDNALSDEDDELDFNCIGHEPLPTRPEAFRPIELVRVIAATHGDRLRQLAICLKTDYLHTRIPRWHQIVHFHQFKQLAFLEIDSRLIRPRKAERFERFTWPRPSKILPPTLIALAVHLEEGWRVELVAWLESLVDDRVRLPLLRILKAFWVLTTVYSPLHFIKGDMTKLKPKLSVVGIDLQWTPRHYRRGEGFMLGREGVWPPAWNLTQRSARPTHDIYFDPGSPDQPYVE